VKATNGGTQASVGNRSNAGASISLKTATFTPNLSRNLSAQSELGTNTPSEVNLGSLNNMQFQLECKLNENDDNDTALIQHLYNMIITNGYKVMWYDYTSASAEKNNGQLVFRTTQQALLGNAFTAGEASNFSVTEGLYHLHVHFFDIQARQTAGTKLTTYTLKGIVIPVETSVI